MSFYYVLLGYMRLHAILFIKKHAALTETIRIKKEFLLMKHVGIILLLLPFPLSGTVVLTIKQNHITSYGTITMLTIATYSFYKIILATIGLIKIKKEHSPLLSTIKNISIADAAMCILPLQSSMLASFDNYAKLNLELMTILTGSAICIIFLWIGITMIIHSRREKNG